MDTDTNAISPERWQQYVETLAPFLTVEAKDGRRWTANHISMSTKAGRDTVISFISSGQLMVLDALDIKDISFESHGRNYCTECDNPLPLYAYHSISKGGTI